MSRDLDFEHDTLEWADPSGRTAFADHVRLRLAAGEREYGNQWCGLGARRLVDELLEEAADIGGWGLLALQSVHPAWSRDELEAVKSIMTAIRMAAGVHEMLERAQSLLADQGEAER